MFAFIPQADFPAHNLNFHLIKGEGDGIESRLPFKIFSTLSQESISKMLALKVIDVFVGKE